LSPRAKVEKCGVKGCAVEVLVGSLPLHVRQAHETLPKVDEEAVRRRTLEAQAARDAEEYRFQCSNPVLWNAIQSERARRLAEGPREPRPPDPEAVRMEETRRREYEEAYRDEEKRRERVAREVTERYGLE
jgi:hypothetical protein